MRRHVTLISALLVSACAQTPAPPASSADHESEPAASAPPETTSHGHRDAKEQHHAGGERDEFVLNTSPRDKSEKRTQATLKPTSNEAAMLFTVVDKDTGPIPGIVISLTGEDGRKFYTNETSSAGVTEVLLPVGQNYDLIYLSLGRSEMDAKVNVPDEPNQRIRLTLRYKRHDDPRQPAEEAPRFVLDGVTFDTAKATIRPESHERLDIVVDYMQHKQSARIEIAGHTDNQGNPAKNKALSLQRAQAVRKYIMAKGIDGSRIEAVGYGDERPIASNDTDGGRQENRRIEASELP